MGAIQDLFESERGLFAIVLVIAATILAALGRMTVSDWQTFATTVFGIYVGGKTLTSSVAIIKGQPSADPAPAVVVEKPATPAQETK